MVAHGGQAKVGQLERFAKAGDQVVLPEHAIEPVLWLALLDKQDVATIRIIVDQIKDATQRIECGKHLDSSAGSTHVGLACASNTGCPALEVAIAALHANAPL